MRYHCHLRSVLLIFRPSQLRVAGMRYVFIGIATFVLSAVVAGSASAACYADYKAKQEDPLRLHYGVMQVDANPCRMSRAVTRGVERRLSSGGWMLLQVESVFDETGLEGRKRDAGQFYLRY